MKIKLKIEKEYDVKKLAASVEVRYWEDASVDGVEDTSGDLIPCRNGDCFEPIICLYSGIILNWERGKDAEIHYKVCDAGEYILLDDEDNEVIKIDGYVIDMMCPEGGGYGDYVIMNVGKEGDIQNWKVSFDEFTDTED